LISVGQIQQQCQCRILPFVRRFVRQKLKLLQKMSDTSHILQTIKKMCRTASNFTLFGQTAHEYNSYNAVGYYPRLKVRYLVYIDSIY